jgi:hypothetical protein
MQCTLPYLCITLRGATQLANPHQQDIKPPKYFWVQRHTKMFKLSQAHTLKDTQMTQ